MDQILSNPRGLIIMCCFGALVVSLNLTLIGVLRGDKRVQQEAAKWTQAIGGGQTARKKQDDDSAELRRMVQDLKDRELTGQDPPHEP